MKELLTAEDEDLSALLLILVVLVVAGFFRRSRG